MSRVGSVGYALARALADESVVVYIGAPDLFPPVRESKPMPPAEAEEFAAELRALGTFLGSPISGVHVGPKSQEKPVKPARTYEDAPGYLSNGRRKVRASDKTWRGERSGPRIDRTTERVRHEREGGFRSGWDL